jgi:hypothetical protein
MEHANQFKAQMHPLPFKSMITLGFIGRHIIVDAAKYVFYVPICPILPTRC